MEQPPAAKSDANAHTFPSDQKGERVEQEARKMIEEVSNGGSIAGASFEILRDRF